MSTTETQYAVQTDLDGGTTCTTQPMYRRIHAEDYLARMTPPERRRSRIVSRIAIVTEWRADEEDQP